MNKKRLTLLICMGLCAVSLTGCYSIRKKFVRKNKAQESVPVYVSLKEYSGAPTQKIYRDYYVFVRGWLDDLNSALREQSSLKRSRRAIDEALMNFTQMYQSLNERGKNERREILDEFMYLKKIVYNPTLFSLDTARVIARVDKLKRVLEKQMSYEAVKGYLESTDDR